MNTSHYTDRAGEGGGGGGGGVFAEILQMTIQSHQRGHKRKRVVGDVTDKVDLALLQPGDIPDVQLRQ